VGRDAGESAGEVGGDEWDGLDGFIIGACKAEFVFEGFGGVEVVCHGRHVFLGGGAGVEESNVGTVNLRSR